MKILFVSKDLVGGNLAYLMKKEGHEVKLYIEEKSAKENFDNLVPKTKNWRGELEWVGRDGLIVFDDVGYGKIQDKLREEGYTVFGGSELGDRLELDREFGQQMFVQCGLKTVELKNFFDIKKAIDYIKQNPKRWVVKHNNHSVKSLTYAGHSEDGSDVINILETFERNGVSALSEITLQEHVLGVEMGVGRYFNGTDWVGPIEINFEHTRFFPGDIGPVTSEMGTLAWYDDNEKNKLFIETLAKMKPFLQRINFRGDMEINCIVNQNGAFPLEATARLGTPIVHLQTEIHTSPWAEFLHAVASGEQYDLKWRRGYGIVVTIAVPPFPYTYQLKRHSCYNTNISFDKKMTSKDFKHIHFEEVAIRNHGKLANYFYISDHRGYIMYATGLGHTVAAARAKTYKIVNQIQIPKMFYRHDIGVKFMSHYCDKLIKWGYIKKTPRLVFSDDDMFLISANEY